LFARHYIPLTPASSRKATASFCQQQLLHYNNNFEPNTNKPINMPLTASDLCKIVLAFFLPPVGVFLERGCNADFFINILLTILGYIPVSLSIFPSPKEHGH
jgi:uncharacterized membrane protein YqaE (UPF0057 family)